MNFGVFLAKSGKSNEVTLTFNLDGSNHPRGGSDTKNIVLWRQFFKALLQEGERVLSFNNGGEKLTAYCRYKNMNVLHADKGLSWVKFNITFNVLRVERFYDDWILSSGTWNDDGIWKDIATWKDVA